MSDYQAFYQALSASLAKQPWLLALLRLANKSITWLMYGLYGLLLVICLIQSDWQQLGSFIVIPGLSFLAISLFRRWVNRPRPYETWDIQPLIAKDTRGHSLPSRHVFSASMVSMCYLAFYWPLGLILLALTVILAVCRVLAGVHYPLDVSLGLVLGLAFGSFFWLI